MRKGPMSLVYKVIRGKQELARGTRAEMVEMAHGLPSCSVRSDDDVVRMDYVGGKLSVFRHEVADASDAPRE